MKRITAFLTAILLLFGLCGCRTTPVTLVGIRVDTPPDRTVYTAGDAFDAAGMAVYGIYSDGGETAITTYAVNPQTLGEGDTQITVSYKGFTAMVDVTVESSEAGFRAVAASLVSPPIRTRYVAGETLDPIGAVFEVTDTAGEVFLTADCKSSGDPLKAGDTAVAVLCGGVEVILPVQVIDGTPFGFVSTYSDAAYAERLATLDAERLHNPFGDRFVAEVKLDDPCPDGVATSRRQLIDAVDYHVFYGVDRAVLRIDYPYTSLEEELDVLYFESDILAGNGSVKGQEIGGGWVEIALKYYDTAWLDPAEKKGALTVCLEPFRTEAAKTARTFAAIDTEHGVTVANSEQVAYALCHGKTIAPVEGSAAELAVGKACEILTACCDDGMTPFQKMYNLYSHLTERVRYDAVGEEWAGNVLDFEREPDMLAATLVSFHAEGCLFYGKAACYGFARAAAILLGLEGLDVTRVTGKDDANKGRSAFGKNEAGDYEPAFLTHSYLYVTIDGKQYLYDVTYGYAGVVSPQEGVDLCWHREFACAVTKASHAEVYKGLSDRVSSAADYRPGMWTPWEKGALCDSGEAAKTYLGTLLDGIGRGDYAAVVFISEAVDKDTARQAIDTALSRCGVEKYCLGLERRTMGGKPYWLYLLTFRK